MCTYYLLQIQEHRDAPVLSSQTKKAAQMDDKQESLKRDEGESPKKDEGASRSVLFDKPSKPIMKPALPRKKAAAAQRKVESKESQFLAATPVPKPIEPVSHTILAAHAYSEVEIVSPLHPGLSRDHPPAP